MDKMGSMLRKGFEGQIITPSIPFDSISFSKIGGSCASSHPLNSIDKTCGSHFFFTKYSCTVYLVFLASLDKNEKSPKLLYFSKIFMRISIQAYNKPQDIEKMLDMLKYFNLL